MLGPIKSDNLYKKIIEAIHTHIVDSDIKPGDRLPSERELGELLEVSRTTVREALRVMEIIGTVQVRVGKGIFLTDLSTESLSTTIASLIMFDKENVDQLYEVREMLDIKNASLAAERATDEDIAKIEAAEKEIQRALIKPKKGLIEEKEYHLSIASATKNSILYNIMKLVIDSYLDLILSVRGQKRKITNRQKEAFGEHSAITQAIKNHDILEAKKAMRNHIRASRDASKAILLGK
jgi:GntR family transcriptional repressor for pyruvate dehydrogenase complex